MAITEQGAATGISFALTDEQKALRDLTHDFAPKEIRPKEADYDEEMQHPADVIAKAHELGLMNLHVPEEYGGLGLGCFDGMLVGEELYWGCAGIGTSVSANGLGSGPVIIAGSDEQKAKWLTPAHRGADPLLVRPLGARRRLRRRVAQDDSGSRRRRVRHQRLEDVHHERRLRGVDGRLREDRPEGRLEGDVGVHRPDGHARRHDREASRQDGAARDRHVRVRAPGRARPGRRTGSARRATASRSRWRRSTSRGPAPRSARSASRRRHTSMRSSTRRSASRSTCRSRCTRRVNFMIADMATEIEASRLLCLAGGVDARPGLRAQGDALLLVRQALRRRHRR